MSKRVPTGCNSIDRLLQGGVPPSKVTLFYGEAETGKSTLAMQCAINCARMGMKTLFMDSDGTFTVQRMIQIAREDYEDAAAKIILTRPAEFKQQSYTINWLESFLNEKFGLVIVDTITSLYRSELSDLKENFALNRELNRQVAYLANIAKTRKVAVLITSQVRSAFRQEGISVEPVATRVLKFWSDIVIKMKPTARRRVIKVILEKTPNSKRIENCLIQIGETGIREYGY